jgi:ankyrin repeat protein
MSKARVIEAVKNLDLESTKALLKAKPALLTTTDRQGLNLLHIACSASCEKLNVSEAASARMVNFLLDQGLAIDTPVGADACTALFFAVARGRNTTLIKLLLRRGAKVTGLFAAGWWEDLDNLDILLRAGAPIDVVVTEGGQTGTPFLGCWCWKKFEAAKFLARKGANVNFQDQKGRTALHHGIEKEFDPALLKWLVQHGASPDIEDHSGVSARQKASRKRDKRFHEALSAAELPSSLPRDRRSSR